MVAQSRPPILITRPEPQASRSARQLRAQDWVGRVHVSALMAPVFAEVSVPEGDFQAVILTSETAALSASRLPGLPQIAWCVGDRTAQVARAKGFTARSTKGDANDLIAAILAAGKDGPLLHLHGRETRGAIAERLSAAGIATQSLVTYAQEPRRLSEAAARLLRGQGPVILPLFSPRSAELLVTQWRIVGARAEAHVVALSGAVAAAAQGLPMAGVTVADRPDGGSLLAALKGLMESGRWA